MQISFGGRATLPGIGLTACVVALLATGSHAQNLLVNGSFENGTFTGSNPQSVSGSTELVGGATNMTGWTVLSGTNVSDIAWLTTGNPYGIVASDGTHSLDLTGYTDHAPYGGVVQTLTLVQGNSYTLNFDLGLIPGSGVYQGPVSVTATIGSLNQTFTFAGTGNSQTTIWGTETATFVATSTITTLTLQGASAGAGGQYIGLDNAKITANAAAPEPASLVLAGMAGLPVLGALRRRRTARQALSD